MFKIYLLIGCFYIQSAHAQPNQNNSTEDKFEFIIKRIDDHIKFDVNGLADESFWEDIISMDQFHQVRPDEYTPPSEKTAVKVAYNKDHLFLTATIHESNPKLIEANQLIQGRAYPFDDRFYLILDTFNNQRSGYFFQLNPNGIRTEGLLDDKSLYNNWSAVWQGQAKLVDDGWVVEMVIPFKSLNFQDDISSWGINFGRIIARKNETISWSSGGSDSWELSPVVAGQAVGISELDQGLGLDIKLSASVTESNTVNIDEGFEPSFDLFYKHNSVFNLATTFNTDFSGTDVDLRILNSSRFSVFLPEKRDFFLQDVDIFEFGNLNENGRPFFSRTIGLNEAGKPLDINIGAKATGRTQRFNYGLLVVEQENESLDKQRIYVARGTANILSESKIGFISTQGSPQSQDSNSLVGIDFNYQNSHFLNQKTLNGGAWYQQTNQAYTNQNNNQAFGASLNYPNDDMSFYFSTTRIEENFQPSLGFINRSNIHESILQGGFQHRFDSDWLLNYYPWLYLRYTNDTAGNLLDKELYFYPLAFRTIKGDYIELAHQVKTEVLNEPFQLFSVIEVAADKYNTSSSHINFRSANTREFSVDLFYKAGDFFDGQQQEHNHTINWRPNKHLAFAATYNSNDIKLPSEDIKTELYNISSEIAINNRWSWLTIIQYDNLSESIGSSSRIQWKPDVLSELFINYNNTHFRTRLNPILENQNVVTVKYSRTFRF